MWSVRFYETFDTEKEPLFKTEAEDYVTGDTKGFRREPPFKTFEGITVPTPDWIRLKPFLYIVVFKYDKIVHTFDVNKDFWAHWQTDPDKIIILIPKKENSVNFIIH